MNCRKLIAVSVCGAGLSIASLAVAQQAQPKKAQPQPTQGKSPAGKAEQAGEVGQNAQWQNTDQTLATCLAIDNQEEVAIAKFAQDKAHSKDVKEFAKMMVKEHQECLQKLQRYAPEATRDGYLMETDQTSKSDNQRTSAIPPKAAIAQPKVQPAGGRVQPADTATKASTATIQQTAGTREDADPQSVQHLDFVQLHRELAEECVRGSKQMLSEKDGTEFDECFIGHQIAKHAAMKNKLVVFQRHASDDLNQILAAGVATTEKHMKHAIEIMKGLEKSESSDSKTERSDDLK